MIDPLLLKRFAQELMMRGICSTPGVAIDTARQFEALWERDERPRVARAEAETEEWRKVVREAPRNDGAQAWVASQWPRVRAIGDKAEAEAVKHLEAKRSIWDP